MAITRMVGWIARDRRSIGMAACMAMLFLAQPTLAQQGDTDQLQATIIRLQAQLDQAHKELTATRQLVEQLTRERDDLAIQLKQARTMIDALKVQLGEPAPPPVRVTELPTDPYAAPVSMLAALKRVYVRDMPDVIGAMDRDEKDARARIERWRRRINHDFHKRVSWLTLVELLPAEGDRTPRRAKVTILEEPTLKAIGGPFRIDLPSRFVARLERPNGPPMWRMMVQFGADLASNPERIAPGAFNTPPLVGPLVEFGYDLELMGLIPAKIEPKPAEPAAQTPATAKPTKRKPR